MKILIPLPSQDFDPTEAAIPWKLLTQNGVKVEFSTPQGRQAECDSRMLKGTGLGILAPLLAADKRAKAAYFEMVASSEFQNPIPWASIAPQPYQGLLLPGGHAPGMREYLESEILQKVVSEFFHHQKPVGAICHGVVLAVRSRRSDGRSVLYDRKTTALLATQEMIAWALTCLWLGNYYRTYPMTVEAEVRSHLANPTQFIKGPLPIFRDSPTHLDQGFCHLDGHYISARWPGDAHRFGIEFLKLLRPGQVQGA